VNNSENRLRADLVSTNEAAGEWHYTCHTDQTDRDWHIRISRHQWQIGDTRREVFVWETSAPGKAVVKSTDEGEHRETLDEAVYGALAEVGMRDQRLGKWPPQ
jgi:hypothetical protein